MKKEKLSDLRKQRGLSQKELAKELHLSNGAIAMYETGKRRPPLSRAITIARFFDTQVEHIQFANREPRKKER